MISPLYIFAGLSFALVIGNMALRPVNGKKLHYAFNAAILGALAANAYLLNNASSVALNTFSVNAFSSFFIMILTLGMLLVSTLAYEYAPDYRDFALLSAFALLGVYAIATATSLVAILIGLELAGIPASFIVLLSRRGSIEAAAKFFILLSIAAAAFSFAMAIFYLSANTVLLGPVAKGSLISLALIIFIAALGFEASVFPFNVLLPDVYQGSSAYATAMLGGVSKKAGFAALMQVVILIAVSTQAPFQLLAALSLLTMLYGNLVALAQDNFKRMMAYSSISQSGYILIGIASQSASGVSSSLFQILAHLLAFIGILAAIAWLEKRNRNSISDAVGLYKENKLLAFAVTLLMLSLVGVPLTAGFVGKFFLILSAVGSGLAWLALFAVLNSVISIFYYAKVIAAIYTNKANARQTATDLPTAAVVVACLLLVILLGVYPQPLLNLTSAAARYLIH